MMPLLALFAFVIFGVMALATDLSIDTHYTREVQNVTDAAALAGAKLLPASPALSDLEAATEESLAIVHNAFPWSVTGSTWAQSLATSGCAAMQCSITVCVGLTAGTPCTVSVSPGSATPFVLTVNAPPLHAAVAQHNGDTHRVEVVLHQASGALFARVFGASSEPEGGHSIAYHFAPSQPFPFALFSRTYMTSGNNGDTVDGNIYAARYLAPQSNGHAGICAGVDSAGHAGYVFLGAPQQDDSGYLNDGQSSTHADPVVEGVSCPVAGGEVAMSADPNSATLCAAGLPGNPTTSTVSFDAQDAVCELDPAPALPVVAPLPNLPAYSSTTCGLLGLLNGSYQPGEYKCVAGPALVINHPLTSGIYEIDAGTGTAGCDVTMDGSVTSLSGVTFYLKGGAGICITLPSGVTITQTPYNGGSGDAGDGRYIAVSDNVATPTITLLSSGLGSSSGIWSVAGTIWLPTGAVTINNKTALEDTGQVIVSSWNDQGGYHQNASVAYNSTLAPSQSELLQLSE